MEKLGVSNTVCIAVVFCAATAITSPAQVLTTLAAFAGSDGANPKSTLIQGIDGNLYGTTSDGGASNNGTVFRVSPGGMLTTLHNFAGHPADGANPAAGVVQGSDGNFYGTTPAGGANNFGTVFKITPTGTLTVLHSFNTTDGASPVSVLVQSSDGSFYGTTESGGEGGGTIFKITPSGTLATVYNFCSQSNCTDGYLPFGGVVQASDGNFYGTTNQGGAHSGGTVFKVTPSGVLTTLYSFCSQTGCSDGQAPFGVLVQAIDGNFYGTTGEGGNGVGTVFKITPNGTLTTLHSFTGGSDGYAPEDGMVQATDGNLYGTTNLGGAHSGGTVFKITLSGTLTTEYNFCSQASCTDGRSSYAGLVQAADGNFYGTTNGGGANGDGTAFKLSVGIVLSPVQFVKVTPCRLVDTRNPNGEFGGPSLQGGIPRFFIIPDNQDCNIPATAAAYSLNVTVAPHGPLGYLTIWPTGKNQPVVSTLNSVDGRVKANAAIVPVGVSAAISVFASNTTDLILDIDGYFAPVSGSTLAFYPLPPCRVADTRNPQEPEGLGPPFLGAGRQRNFPVLNATSCLPTGVTPAAYSFNVTAIPHGQLGYLTVWPTGENQPGVSTLNAPTGVNTANAAIVPAGTGGQISTYVTNNTDLAIDINGYFAPSGPGGLSLYPVAPCRVIDTRPPSGSGPFQFELNPPVDVRGSACAPPSQAQAYVFNATVVPQGPLGYLSLWPDGGTQPVVSTLNANDGVITSNMAIVPAGTTNGEVDAYAFPGNQNDPNDLTNLILDISGYFAP
ncbi:MAG: choice-of-anchor tandem repeat GloVer-containing protein [Candidatus Korobacteraceae bacterium]|jgi:uncharacterized repeat protein (TIGR03803 family)